ncbi:MAG: hypothetical protein ACJAZ2_000191 [Glaciecola sp.]|jgi:hypothetical protein
MKKFILKTTCIVVPLVLIPLCFFSFFGYPPPYISTDISFNAKVKDIKDNHLDDEIDILSIGSSMTLNNVHTETIKLKVGDKYLNISSWGQNMEENYFLLKVFSKYYTPTTVIISSNYMDFNNYSKSIKYDVLCNYLFDNGLSLLRHQNPKYLVRETISMSNKKYHDNNFINLQFDKSGGVNFEKSGFKIDENRWNGRPITDNQIDEKQYNFLDSIAVYCYMTKIRLIFSQSPFRQDYSLKLKDKERKALNNHERRVKSIINNGKHTFINSNDEVWDDENFVDYAHLSKAGAKKYTEYIVSIMNKPRN